MYTTVHGLPSDRVEGIARDAQGRRWVATARGLAVWQDGRCRGLTPRDGLFEEAITCVRVNDRVVLGEDSAEERDVVELRARPSADHAATIEVPAGAERLVEIHNTACSLALPTRTRFRYRLEGLETKWTEANTRRVAYYTDLRPGRYRFGVETCNSRGVWSERPATIALVHPPGVVELPVLRFAVAVLLVAVGAGLYRLPQAIRGRRRLAEARSLVERERARIARDIHEDLGVRLTRVVLLSQMAARVTGGQPGQPIAQADVTEATLKAVQSLAEVV